MKTYSIAFKSRKGHWVTNWNQYSDLDDVDWPEVKQYVDKSNTLVAYGYYYGHNSRNLCSKRTRTVLWEKE